LPLLGDDKRFWTAEEAAALLGPPNLSPAQVRRLVAMAGLEAIGRRRVKYSGAGREARCYKAIDLIRLYDALGKVREEEE
jgi:hypothetical protein